MKTALRFLKPVLTTLVVVAGFVFLLRNNATAREISGEAFWLLFTFFSTPFILESTLAIIGFLIVISWNQRRLEQEGDGWVEMEVPVAEAVAPIDPKTDSSAV